LELVEAGLEATRFNTGSIDLQRLTFEVVELMEDAAAAYQVEAGRRRNAVEVHVSPGLGVMRADPTHLREALIELLRWANVEVREGSLHLDAEVEVDSEQSEWILLSVSHTGPALSEEDRASMFQVLAGTSGETGDAARTMRRGTRREICRSMGGDLLVSRTREGRDALTIRMPRGR